MCGVRFIGIGLDPCLVDTGYSARLGWEERKSTTMPRFSEQFKRDAAAVYEDNEYLSLHAASIEVRVNRFSRYSWVGSVNEPARRPCTMKPALTRLVIHSDRGCHYRGNSWIQASRDIGFARSMSKKGCSPDNSVCEGLFGRMKNAVFYGRKWRHREELEKAIHEYVGSYNDRRIKLEFDRLIIN